MKNQETFLEITTEAVEDFQIHSRTKKSLISHGITCVKDFEGKNEDSIKKCGIGEKGLYELKQYLKFTHKVKIAKPEKKKIENYEDCVQVVEHFLGKGPGVQWAREIKTASQLLQRHSAEVLLKVTPPPKIYSLGYFMQDFGEAYLIKNSPVIKGTAVSSIKKEEEIIPDEELLEYTKVEKPKSLKSFLGI